MIRTIRRLLLLLALVGMLPVVATAHAQTMPPISTFLPLTEIGDDWAESDYATDIAFGDVDGDGRDEVAVVRSAVTGPRVVLLDDAAADFAPLTTFGDAWGAGSYATSVAFGNVDGDAAAEIGITRATSVNERAILYDDAAANYAQLQTWGADWDAAVHGVAIAFGDTDGDNADEIALANNANSGPRVFLYDSAAAGYAFLWDAAGDWGSLAVATSVALGDSDGDGQDEVGVTRRHDSNARVFLYAGDDGAQLWATGNTWGAGAWATDIAFGNVDDDDSEEIGVARRNSVNERGFVFDDAGAGFAVLGRLGMTWTDSAYGTSIAFGDVDNDGRDEVGLARETPINPRFYVHDDALAASPFVEMWAGGARWPTGDNATAIAFGQVNATPALEMGVGRLADEGPRAWVYAAGWSSRLPLVTGGAEEEPAP